MVGLGLLKWGAVIYLGTTCRQFVLKMFAIVLPVLVIVLMLWRTLKFVV